MDERKRKVLQAIVEEYINSAEPVSSNSIMNKYDLNCSSATIRNEMADLEKGGFLDKVHTSSGRVPSAKGYRFYVDELMQDDRISLDEIKYISEKLETKVHEIEDLTKITATTISEMTHYTAVTIGPKATEQIIKEIKFVLLGSRMVLAIIMTDTGMVKETIIKFDEDISEKQVETLNYMFNNKLKDQPKEKIYLEGARRELDLPEFNSLDVAKNFMSIIDTKELMADMLNSGFAEDINIYIGEENEKEELKDFSVVTFKHKVDNKDMGTIGIIGPKRMDYAKVISIMKYISKKLNEKN